MNKKILLIFGIMFGLVLFMLSTNPSNIPLASPAGAVFFDNDNYFFDS